MNLSTTQAGRKTSFIGKKGVALAVGTALSALLAGTAYAGDDGRRDEHHDKQSRQREEQHRDRDRDRDRDRHGYVNGNYYTQPLYVPPVVAFVPVQSPGVSLFIPLDIHLR